VQEPFAAQKEGISVVHLPVQMTFFPREEVLCAVNIMDREMIGPATVQFDTFQAGKISKMVQPSVNLPLCGIAAWIRKSDSLDILPYPVEPRTRFHAVDERLANQAHEGDSSLTWRVPVND